MEKILKLKRRLKKLAILPVYGVYYCFFELLLGFGVEDIWDKLAKWAGK